MLEGCFGIIYHVRQRPFIKQNLMAFGMLLLFIILIPIMAVAGSLPSFITGLLSSIGIGKSPVTNILYPILGIVVALFVAWILFEAIFMVVPNQKISFKHSWLGALVAAVLLEIFVVLFPLYIAHFLTGYAASISSVIIILIFFYYFGVILFLGAEVNAVFSEHINSPSTNLVSMVVIMAGQEKEQQEAMSHKPAATGTRHRCHQGGESATTTKQSGWKREESNCYKPKPANGIFEYRNRASFNGKVWQAEEDGSQQNGNGTGSCCWSSAGFSDRMVPNPPQQIKVS